MWSFAHIPLGISDRNNTVFLYFCICIHDCLHIDIKNCAGAYMCACHSEMIDMADICSTNLQSYAIWKITLYVAYNEIFSCFQWLS